MDSAVISLIYNIITFLSASLGHQYFITLLSYHISGSIYYISALIYYISAHICDFYHIAVILYYITGE